MLGKICIITTFKGNILYIIVINLKFVLEKFA